MSRTNKKNFPSYSVGYPTVCSDERFSDIVYEYQSAIAQVYFSMPGQPSGRFASSKTPHTESKTERLFDELIRIKRANVKLNLLLNANCYGEQALSKALADSVRRQIILLQNEVGGIDSITTASAFIAHVVKNDFPKILIRASVNMGIGSIKAMRYVQNEFDAFGLSREQNRKIQRVRACKTWCDQHRKTLVILANSGCLDACSGQIFHDNLLAHAHAMQDVNGAKGFVPHLCWRLYQSSENRPLFMKNTWIRPEDVARYAPHAHEIKLATRVHPNPATVIDAYVRRCWHGNLIELFEPLFQAAFAPFIIDNDAFPSDWFEKTADCTENCEDCGYCERVYERVCVNVNHL